MINRNEFDIAKIAIANQLLFVDKVFYQETKTNKFKILILIKTKEIVIVQDKSRSKKEKNYKKILIIK